MDFHTSVSPLPMKIWREFPCIPSFYHLWLVFWNLIIVHLEEVSCGDSLVGPAFVWIFFKYTEGSQQDLLNSAVFVCLCVCLERLADNHHCSLMWWHLLCEEKNIWAFQDVGQDCFLLAAFMWAGNGNIIVVNSTERNNRGEHRRKVLSEFKLLSRKPREGPLTGPTRQGRALSLHCVLVQPYTSPVCSFGHHHARRI